MVEGEQRQSRGVVAGRDGLSHDAPGVDVGDERDIAEPRHRAHVGGVSNPELVRTFSSEAALDEVRAGIRLTCRAGRDRLAATAYAFHEGELHQPDDVVTTNHPTGPDHGLVHLPHPVDAVVLRVDSLDSLE